MPSQGTSAQWTRTLTSKVHKTGTASGARAMGPRQTVHLQQEQMKINPTVENDLLHPSSVASALLLLTMTLSPAATASSIKLNMSLEKSESTHHSSLANHS